MKARIAGAVAFDYKKMEKSNNENKLLKYSRY